ncbi:hypothetical protein [Castellaniella sp.]|uniref:hypothetical protein n=1 Tax=Castellaniella sp. TaxID=1955812 RepID=UPI00355D5F34
MTEGDIVRLTHWGPSMLMRLTQDRKTLEHRWLVRNQAGVTMYLSQSYVRGRTKEQSQ